MGFFHILMFLVWNAKWIMSNADWWPILCYTSLLHVASRTCVWNLSSSESTGELLQCKFRSTDNIYLLGQTFEPTTGWSLPRFRHISFSPLKRTHTYLLETQYVSTVTECSVTQISHLIWFNMRYIFVYITYFRISYNFLGFSNCLFCVKVLLKKSSLLNTFPWFWRMYFFNQQD